MCASVPARVSKARWRSGGFPPQSRNIHSLVRRRGGYQNSSAGVLPYHVWKRCAALAHLLSTILPPRWVVSRNRRFLNAPFSLWAVLRPVCHPQRIPRRSVLGSIRSKPTSHRWAVPDRRSVAHRRNHRSVRVVLGALQVATHQPCSSPNSGGRCWSLRLPITLSTCGAANGRLRGNSEAAHLDERAAHDSHRTFARP